jgi:hypothetical protein
VIKKKFLQMYEQQAESGIYNDATQAKIFHQKGSKKAEI